MPLQFSLPFSSKTSRTSQSVVSTRQNSRRPTTISMLEEEFGMREAPKAATRFGLPPKLRILPPKRKKSTTQAPEPRRSPSLSKGSWETVWACDGDGVNLVESVEFPLEYVDSPSGSFIFPDYRREHASDFSHWDNGATPTNGTPWSPNEEFMPLLSSDLPDALKCECHLCEKLLESEQSPIEPDTP